MSRAGNVSFIMYLLYVLGIVFNEMPFTKEAEMCGSMDLAADCIKVSENSQNLLIFGK